MGIGDKLKQGAGAARLKLDESREAASARAEADRLTQATRDAETAERERQLADKRLRLFDEVRQTAPLPVSPDRANLPGGLTLFDDEFLVTVGKDWGWSSQKLVLTTKRVIYSRGRALTAKDQQTVYLMDVRDVRFHKPLMGPGSIAVETAGGASIEGLPAAKNGAKLRDDLLALVHWARSEDATSRKSSPALPEARSETSIAEKLKQLAELHVAGLLTQQEFDAKKAELLAQL